MEFMAKAIFEPTSREVDDIERDGRPEAWNERSSRRHRHVLIGLETVQRQLVLGGIDGDRLDAELVGGAQDTDGDFAAVGNEEFLDLHRVISPKRK